MVDCQEEPERLSEGRSSIEAGGGDETTSDYVEMYFEYTITLTISSTYISNQYPMAVIYSRGEQRSLCNYRLHTDSNQNYEATQVVSSLLDSLKDELQYSD